ncbi:hypothetical protein [Anaerosolibacter sp.]|uniref:hypothetical protein n=1 Tax=Anaerosolibacter sp. TaxID=1872527 RepID=UPI0039EEAD3B
MAQSVGIREYLNQLGLDNSQIGFNPNNQMVTYQGKNLLQAGQNVGGTTYADPSQIKAAVYRGGFMPQQSYQSQTNDVLSQLMKQVNKPFEYNPRKDPRYQAVQDAAERNAQTASRNAMEAMNERGILNSTITGDRIGQIEQEAKQRVTDLIPQLMESAYNQRQNETNNLLQLLGVYQGLENQSYNRNQVLDQTAYERGLQEQQAEAQAVAQQAQLQQQQLEQALSRVDSLGYVDNAASQILGVPVGTPSFRAREAAADRANRIRLEGISAANRLAAIEKEYGLRAQERQSVEAEETAKQADSNAVYNAFYDELDAGTADQFLKNNRKSIIDNLGLDVYNDLLKTYKSTQEIDLSGLNLNE